MLDIKFVRENPDVVKENMMNPGVAGYRQFFGFLIVMLILGAIFVVIWKAYLKKHVTAKAN